MCVVTVNKLVSIYSTNRLEARILVENTGTVVRDLG